MAALIDLLDRDPVLVREIINVLPPAAIRGDRHDVYLAIASAAQGSDTPTLVDVAAQLQRGGNARGSESYNLFTDAIDNRIATGKRAAAVARDAATRLAERHARVVALTSAAAFADGDGSSEDAEDLQEKLNRLRSPVFATEDPTTGLLDELEEWNRDDPDIVIPTCFWPLDTRMDGGLAPGLIGVAGQPGAGKSALAAQIMLGALLHDRNLVALWCRGEMSRKRLHSRLITAWSALRGDEVPHVTFRDARQGTTGARKVAADKANVIGHERLRYLHMPLTVEGIAAAIARRRPRLVIVDHLGKIQCDGKRERRLELEDIVQRLFEIAMANEVAMIVTTPVAKNTDEDSAIGTITKDSNRLDYDAETFISLWTNRKDVAAKKDPRDVVMNINKNRAGPEEKVPILFTGHGQHFYSTDPEPEEFDEFAAFAHGSLR